jgi:hypothetical protein
MENRALHPSIHQHAGLIPGRVTADGRLNLGMYGYIERGSRGLRVGHRDSGKRPGKVNVGILVDHDRLTGSRIWSL